MAETGVTVLIPALNEAAALPRLVAALERLEPKPAEILCIDGGSTDDTIAIAKAADWRMLDCEKGRAKQINFGVAEARGALVVTLAVFLLGFTPVTRDPWWHQSQLMPTFEGAAGWLSDRLPDTLRRYLHPVTEAAARSPASLPLPSLVTNA